MELGRGGSLKEEAGGAGRCAFVEGGGKEGSFTRSPGGSFAWTGGLGLGWGFISSVLFSAATLLSFAGFEATAFSTSFVLGAGAGAFSASFVLGADDGEPEGAGVMPPDSDGTATRFTINVLGAFW
jgi:hypothetical protein